MKTRKKEKSKKVSTGPDESEGRGFESFRGARSLAFAMTFLFIIVRFPCTAPWQPQTAGAFLIYIPSDYLRLFQAVPKLTTPAQSSAASASRESIPGLGQAPPGGPVFLGARYRRGAGAGVAVAAGGRVIAIGEHHPRRFSSSTAAHRPIARYQGYRRRRSSPPHRHSAGAAVVGHGGAASTWDSL